VSSGEVLVAVLSAVGGLGVGASVGALVTRLLREGAEHKRREAELKGLLRLISVEITLHKLGWEDHLNRDPRDYVGDPGLIQAPGRSLRADAWEQVRPKIAQLLPSDRFASLGGYYSNVQWFNELLDDHTSPRTRMTLLPKVANGLAEDGPKMRIRKVL
jgi:hypothetical protein